MRILRIRGAVGRMRQSTRFSSFEGSDFWDEGVDEDEAVSGSGGVERAAFGSLFTKGYFLYFSDLSVHLFFLKMCVSFLSVKVEAFI